MRLGYLRPPMSAVEIGSPVPDALADAEVLTREGQGISLGSLLEGRPALLVFLRHFGCIGCTMQIAAIEPRLPEFSDLGMRTIVVGNGTAEFIDEFRQRHMLVDKQVTIVTDPSLRAFEALALRRTFFSAWGFRPLLGAVLAKGRGLSGYRGPGDTYQQGGALVIDADGVVQYFHRNEHLSDQADTNDLVDAAMRVLYRANSENKGLV